MNQALWGTPIIPALRRGKQEDQEFKAPYRWHSRSNWATGDPISNNSNKKASLDYRLRQFETNKRLKQYTQFRCTESK